MRTKFLIFLILSSISGFAQNTNFLLNYSVNPSRNEAIIDTFYKFINEKDFVESSKFWTKDNYLSYPNYDFIAITREAERHNLTILAITKISEERYNVKVAWIKNTEGYGNLFTIYNFIANIKNDTVSFENCLNENVKNFSVNQVEEIKYICYKGHVFDHDKAKKMRDFSAELAAFFETKKISFTYFLFKDVAHLKAARGFDFDAEMVINNQIGGEAFTFDNIIFSGNNSEYYPHELVHLYTYANFNGIHTIIDEGIATFFGGSKGLNFKEHLQQLNVYLKTNNIDIYEKLFNADTNYIISDTTSLKYSIGSLLCDVALRKKGKKALINLMNSGKSDEELKKSIESIFEIKMEKFDEFVKNELTFYND